VIENIIVGAVLWLAETIFLQDVDRFGRRRRCYGIWPTKVIKIQTRKEGKKKKLLNSLSPAART